MYIQPYHISAEHHPSFFEEENKITTSNSTCSPWKSNVHVCHFTGSKMTARTLGCSVTTHAHPAEGTKNTILTPKHTPLCLLSSIEVRFFLQTWWSEELKVELRGNVSKCFPKCLAICRWLVLSVYLHYIIWQPTLGMSKIEKAFRSGQELQPSLDCFH